MKYDKNNIFAKILRGEIPCNKVFENKYVLSFYDINPKKKIHVLVIPKGEYTDLDHFNSEASDIESILHKNFILVPSPQYVCDWSTNDSTNGFICSIKFVHNTNSYVISV